MNLSEFVQKHKGNRRDPDGVWGAQCMDLFRLYEKELGFPRSPGVKIAAQVWEHHNPELWEKVPYTPGAFPAPGCVVIWDRRYGGTGHIAVSLEGCTQNKLVVISQNDPFRTPVGERVYENYDLVLGWLVPIQNNK